MDSRYYFIIFLFILCFSKNSYGNVKSPTPLKLEPVVEFRPVKRIRKIHPFIEFINKDVWEYMKFNKKCYSFEDGSMCAKVNKDKIFFIFTYRF